MVARALVEYTTIDDDYIDAIVFKHYGFVDEALETVMNDPLNRGLRVEDESLPGGIKIYLPPLKDKPDRVVRLWD